MRNFTPLFAMALVGAVAFAPVTRAQTAPAAGPALVAPTIALVDMQRVVSESAAGRSIQTQLDTERRKIRDQLGKIEEELKNGENELKRQRAVEAPEKWQEEVQAYQRKQADAQRLSQDRQEAFTKGSNDAINVVVDNMRDVVQQIATERHIGLVVRKDVAISMTDKNMDITDDVIQRLNTKLPTVSVTIASVGSSSAAAPAQSAPAAAKAPAKK